MKEKECISIYNNAYQIVFDIRSVTYMFSPTPLNQNPKNQLCAPNSPNDRKPELNDYFITRYIIMKNLSFLVSFIFLLTSCQGINLASTPTISNQETNINTPIPAKSLTPTSSPTIIPSATSTSSSIPPNQPIIGDPFWWWGGNSDTYQVWINNLKLMCGQWICPNDNSNHLYNTDWVYVGQAIGNATFTFPFPAKDIVISWGTGEMFAFDALVGIVGDETVGYGFTLEGEPSATWMDGSDTISMETLINFDFPNCNLLTPSGMVGMNADHNYNITENRGGILFRFIDTPCKKLLLEQRPVDVGDSSYLLNGLSVFVKPTSQLDSTDVISP